MQIIPHEIPPTEERGHNTTVFGLVLFNAPVQNNGEIGRSPIQGRTGQHFDPEQFRKLENGQKETEITMDGLVITPAFTRPTAVHQAQFPFSAILPKRRRISIDLLIRLMRGPKN